MDRFSWCLASWVGLCVAVCGLPVSVKAQGTETRQELEVEDLPPEAIRKRIRAQGRELDALQTRLVNLKAALAEMENIEIAFSASDDDGPDMILGASPETVSPDEIAMRARMDMVEALGRFSPETLKSTEAKALFVAMRAAAVEVPTECSQSEKPRDGDQATEASADAWIKAIRTCAQALTAKMATIRTSNAEKISSAKGRVSLEIKGVEDKISATNMSIEELESVEASADKLTITIVRWTIPTVGLLLLAIFLGPKLYSASVQAEIFNSKLNLELITVYILVSTILILGLANRLDNEVLGTLLGGISGYVLGRTLQKNSREQTQSSAPKNEQGEAAADEPDGARDETARGRGVNEAI